MLARTILLCCASAIAGIFLVLACGDDSPPEVDAAAAVCDCPEAEPPLSGRIVLEEHAGNISNGNARTTSWPCDLVDGYTPQVLSGGCRILDQLVANTGNVELVESYKYLNGTTEGWGCSWNNQTGADVDVVVTLTCLLPPPGTGE